MDFIEALVSFMLIESHLSYDKNAKELRKILETELEKHSDGPNHNIFDGQNQ